MLGHLLVKARRYGAAFFLVDVEPRRVVGRNGPSHVEHANSPTTLESEAVILHPPGLFFGRNDPGGLFNFKNDPGGPGGFDPLCSFGVRCLALFGRVGTSV